MDAEIEDLTPVLFNINVPYLLSTLFPIELKYSQYSQRKKAQRISRKIKVSQKYRTLLQNYAIFCNFLSV